MSLINDALKRARHEAARREAEAKGLPASVPPGQVFGRRGAPRLRPLLAGVAILAAAAVGIVFFFAGQQAARRGGDGAPGIEVAEATGDTPLPVPRGAAADPGAEGEPPGSQPGDAEPPAETGAISGAASPRTAEAAAGDGETPGASRRAGEPRPSPNTEPSGGDERASRAQAGSDPGVTGSDSSSPARSASPPPARPAPAAPPAPARVAPPDERAATGVASISDPASGVILVLPEAGRSRSASAAAARRPEESGRQGAGTASYIQTFTTPDGGTIELGGIAWSETGPFALINGQVLGAGSSVHGFVIERIHPRQVELRSGSATVFLTLQ